VTERTHNEIWDKIIEMEGDMGVLSERVESTREMMTRNTVEFKDRITNLEDGQTIQTTLLAAHRAEFKTGTAVLGFLIVAGISIMGILVA
jgi:hypothetical protein